MPRKPLLYTFGNHMHWVDMEWLWGYDTLPSSVRDMLALIEATGARGNVNFDAVGYEKLALEAPEALNELRAAISAGKVEVVGGSYGQPYGLFHGGESNVRQRVYGARAVRRMLGVWPTAFWEEEFDFFPQLPQMLASCGYRSAALFFQWTWSTPHVPDEPHALILWEGHDGTRLPALPKNELCLHQWPEDFEGRLESKSARELARPAIVQWLELMPSPDWMCRSELILPRLKELFSDQRFEVRPGTLSQLVAELSASGERPPVRRYSLDDVWHGVTLGKNGDYMPRYSRTAEEQLLAAESISRARGPVRPALSVLGRLSDLGIGRSLARAPDRRSTTTCTSARACAARSANARSSARSRWRARSSRAQRSSTSAAASTRSRAARSSSTRSVGRATSCTSTAWSAACRPSATR
jgi:alpha-mannosidase